MPFRLLADLALLLHGAFVLFVAAGGLLVWRRPRLALFHLPAAAWGVAVELAGWPCPLTLLEDHWRRLGGETVATASCLDRYLAPLLYPPGLERRGQLVLGLLALLLNLWVYLRLWRRRRPRP